MLPAPKSPLREIPADCPGLSPRHRQPRYVHGDSYFVLSLIQGWRSNSSPMNCVTATRLCREVSSELPGRNTNEVPPFLFLLSLLWLWHWRFFWSVNAQLVLSAQNALPKVMTVQEILCYCFINPKLKMQAEKSMFNIYLNDRKKSLWSILLQVMPAPLQNWWH